MIVDSMESTHYDRSDEMASASGSPYLHTFTGVCGWSPIEAEAAEEGEEQA
jgi:hypothetical protein